MPRLEVLVGPNRFQMEPCRVNDSLHPHEIDTEHFVGRVLVRIVDAPGGRVGEPGHAYFKDRSRRFCIQIEGRFKRPWSGDDILFGSDFDKFVPFPRAPFNAGMRVARMIDPCTFYEEHPPSGRPFIMSPYAACMNVLCAWPAPHRLDDAVVVNHVSGVTPSLALEHCDISDGDIVPVEQADHSEAASETHDKRQSWLLRRHTPKEERVTRPYWRFIGFRQDARVQAYVRQHPPEHTYEEVMQRHAQHAAPVSSPLVPQPQAVPAQAAPAPALVRPTPVSAVHAAVQPPILPPIQQGIDAGTMSGLGALSRHTRTSGHAGVHRTGTPRLPAFMSSDMQHVPSLPPSDSPHGAMQHTPPLTYSARSSPAPHTSVLWPDGSRPASVGADVSRPASVGSDMSILSPGATPSEPSRLDTVLGPWRFADPSSDMIEDNAFVFTHESVSVPKRRKHFANEQNRKNFTYDPDVVYGASFFTNLFDFNTFDLNIGPVHINVKPFFREMPIRYTLRSKNDEELVFCTIAFQIVDD